MNRVYFDNAATTPIAPQVIEAMTKAMQEQHGNPSSIHADGRAARTLIEQSRKTIAQSLNASIGEVFFTSGGTEANNMALKCAVRDLGVTRIISSPTEHHCVLHSLDNIEENNQGISVVKLELDDKGLVNMNQLETLLQDKTHKTLVTLMHANNEIGTMIDLERVGELCAEAGAYFHTDTVQTIGFYPIDVEKIKISFLSGAGHKFYGPKGVGFIYINNDNIIRPFVDGGAQERNMRGGTENIYGIVGMAKALELMLDKQEEYEKHIRALRAIMVKRVKEELPMIDFNGDVENGHYKTLNL
ncbi:MAG: cysteine desulfurase family protein, partial [Bacteroidota bacterium]